VIGNILGSSEFTALLLTTITALVGFAVSTAAWAWRKYVLRRLSAQELETLQRVADLAVVAAEQMGLGQTGEEKLALALDFASKQLAVYGIAVTPEQLRAAIEAAVYGNITQVRLAREAAAPTTYITGTTSV
jgi:hypothetical protein